MAKRPKFSRWRRNPGTFRFGEQKAPDPNEEVQRLTLYIPGSSLDLAEAQAIRLGYPSSQEYCTDLILTAIQTEKIKDRVADVETKHGPFAGLHQIADDPAYLDDLRQAGNPRFRPAPVVPTLNPQQALPTHDPGMRWTPPPPEFDDGVNPSPPIRVGATLVEKPKSGSGGLSGSAKVVLRHAALGEYDPGAFLPSLRRGEAVSPEEVAELAQALNSLENEQRSNLSMDRKLAFSLHRLAYESQILHTDAWPGAFDLWTVEMLRAVQEAAERILSGQDIRYDSLRDESVEAQGTEPDPRPSFSTP